jgi:hypothetical protein
MTTALMKTGVIAIVYFSAWAYRCLSRGDSLSSKRVVYGAALILMTFAVASAWQAASKVKGWSWWMTFLGFTLSLVFVSIAVVAVVRSMAFYEPAEVKPPLTENPPV